jgi:hypothetical protein
MFSTLRKMILLVLGIPFVILGTRFLLDAGQSALVHQASGSWTPITVELVSVEHFSSVDQALGNQTLVDYRYEFEGHTFEGQFSCIGDECPQTDLHLSLRAAQEEKRAVAALINPDDPAQSLLYRNLYMPLFLLKAGVGLFCFLTGSVSVIFGVYLLSGAGAARGRK